MIYVFVTLWKNSDRSCVLRILINLLSNRDPIVTNVSQERYTTYIQLEFRFISRYLF